MGKKFLAAICCLLAVVLALTAVSVGVRATMPDYPDILSLNPEITQKITGQYLVAAAAAEGNTVTVFGSSELKTTDIATHPTNFFEGQRAGFQVNLVGRGSCQSLVHALSIAASGDALAGQKVVLITAPQSYVEGGIAPDLFMANFSEQQVLTMLADETLPQEIKDYLSTRVQELICAYNEDMGTSLQKYTAAGLMTKYGDRAWLKPYAAVSSWLLNTRDLAASRRAMQDYGDVLPEPRPIDWTAEEQAALEQAAEMVTNNDYFMQDSYFNTYIGRKLDQQKDKDADLSYAQSPEYDDLRCLLEICGAKGLDVLFVHVPMHGSWNDYTGFTAEKRAQYYENVRQIVTQYDVELLDLTAYEYEPYFLCDTMHLGWKGWLEVDRAICAFYEEG